MLSFILSRLGLWHLHAVVSYCLVRCRHYNSTCSLLLCFSHTLLLSLSLFQYPLLPPLFSYLSPYSQKKPINLTLKILVYAPLVSCTPLTTSWGGPVTALHCWHINIFIMIMISCCFFFNQLMATQHVTQYRWSFVPSKYSYAWTWWTQNRHFLTDTTPF